MARYIDADLIEYHDLFTNDGEYARVAFGDDIDVLPTADVVDRNECSKCVLHPFKQLREQLETNMVEVVQCKECKYRKFIDWGMGDCVHPKGSKHIAYDYHYCSYGERREDAEIY